MDLRRLRAGEWMAAISGSALLASLFLPWYETALGQELAGWEAMAVNDVLLATAALLAIALLPITASQRAPAVPIALDALVTIAATLAAMLVLVRLAWLPDGASERDWGLWLALASALGIFLGAAIAMRDERLSRPGRPTDATGARVERPPEIETLPAPRP